MKRLLPLLLLTVALSFSSKAQYVNIPDANFVAWLDSSGFSSCLSGNQLDTTCPQVLNAHTIRLANLNGTVQSLSGIQYFKNLDTLKCANNPIDSFPLLPASLIYIDCGHIPVHALTNLPPHLQVLYMDFDSLTTLPALPASLQVLSCIVCNFSQLPVLPDSLLSLTCSLNPLNTLPSVWPTGLLNIDCEVNNLSSLPALPPNLQYINCSHNNLTGLPQLPDSLGGLLCSYNMITALPLLPPYIQTLDVSNNPLHNLPDTLPPYIEFLYCSNDSLTILPPFPPYLYNITCSHNQLVSLPPLPDTSPYGSAFYLNLDCSYNYLTSLPNLPTAMAVLQCNDNPYLTCLPQIGTITTYLNFDTTAITCLPNYGTVDSSSPLLNTVPLCGVLNPGACGIYWDISGTVFYDANADCQYNIGDSGLCNVKLMLYSGDTLQQQIITGNVGDYSFQAANYNSYTIVIDTTNIPFAFNPTCPDTGSIPVTLATDSFTQSNNFSFVCYPQGFDVGVQSIWYNYSIVTRPAAVIEMHNVAGDLSALYGAHCASGISGQVQLVLSGPATYLGPAPGAITPTVNGNTLTWPVTDFGVVNDLTAFNIILQINSNATAGDVVYINLNVTPDSGDYNLLNNSAEYSFTVVNALDPNEKEVSPTHIDSAGQWLTYTIRFQNTGSAPAANIVVLDTLSSRLDPSTFTLLNYSAKPLTQLFGNVVKFSFAQINLPDSATGDSISRGYVQFKIKTAGTFAANYVVSNTAYIYFDLNPAVVTNTVTNYPTGIAALTQQSNVHVTAFPNPFSDITNIEIEGLTGTNKYNFQLYDVTGRLQLNIPSGTANHFQITRGKLAAGIYTYRLIAGEEGVSAFGKLVVQ